MRARGVLAAALALLPSSARAANASALVWDDRAVLTRSRDMAGAACVNGTTVFIAGGSTRSEDGSGEVLSDVEALEVNETTASWVTKDPLLVPSLNGALCAASGTVYAIGGADGLDATAETQAYNVENDWWDEVPGMPTPRYGHAAASFGNQCYVFGGAKAAPPSAEVPEITLNVTEVLDATKQHWESLPPIPTGRWGLAAAVDPATKRVYVVGGFNNERRPLDTVEIFDIATRTWITDGSVPADPLPTPRGGLALGILDGRLIAASGVEESATEVGVVEIMDLATGKWTIDSPLPSPRGAVASVVCNSSFYVIGGSTNAGMITEDSVYITSAGGEPVSS